jgi:uncharacterized protein (TIGR03067 family)
MVCPLLETLGWDDPVSEDGKMLEGAWPPVAAELGGQKFPDDHLKAVKLIMKDGQYTVQVGEVFDEGTYKLDPAAKPRAIDITGSEGPNKGKTLLAIYELTGDSLRVYYNLEGKKRPTDFKTEKNTLQFLVSYKREKP